MKLRRNTQSVIWGFVLSGLAVGVACADDWPQWLGPQRDGIWRETGIVDKFPAGGPTVRWRAPLGGGYAGPAVAGGRVFVTDRVLPEGANNPNDQFKQDAVAGKERVLCFNEADGKLLWTHEYECTYTISYPAGPRTTPLVAGGKVYTLGAMGRLCCLDAATGKELWSRELRKDFNIRAPVWGFAGHPLLDGQRLICLVGGDGSTAVAFDKDSGKEIWRALSAKEPGYSPPMIYEAGGKRQLILWHPEALNSLDPETGKLYWSEPFAVRVGLSLATPAPVGNPFGSAALTALTADVPAHVAMAEKAGDEIARNASAGLARAFRGAYAPVRQLIMESKSPRELERSIRLFFADLAPGRQDALIEEALTAYGANGATAGATK